MRSYNAKDRMVARNIGSENLAKLGKPIARALEKAGLTDEYLMNGIKEGTSAKKPLIINGKVAEYPDHSVRHKYYETALKLGARFPKEEININETSNKTLRVIIEENTELLEGEIVDDKENISTLLE